MGQVVSLEDFISPEYGVALAGKARRRARERALSRHFGGEAQILFFLGVRYCREEQGGDDAGAPARGRGGKLA